MTKKKQVDVLFIPAPLCFPKKERTGPSGDETSIPPLGLMYIASFLNSKGYRCKILEVGLKGLSLSQTIQKIKKINPRVVGLSILLPSTITGVQIAKEIKKKLPRILIGCGGPHICVDPDFFKRYPYFDFGVKGEGELIMLKIMNKLDRGEKVAGLYNGGYVADLDKLPFPDYSLIHFEEYGYPLDKVGKRWTAVSIVSSRGCPFNCTFCCKTESRRYVRFRSPDNIVDEIEKNLPLAKKGGYSFVDDTMTFNRKNTEQVCRKILERGIKISWIAMTRADCLDLSMAKLLRKAGCRELLIGVESGDERVRNKVVKKMVEDRDVAKAIKICRQVGIRSSIFLMLGFPTEGKKEMEKTVNYGLVFQPDIIGLHLTGPIPGSELFGQAIKEGIVPPDVVDQYVEGKLGDYSNWPKYIPKGLSLDYLEKARARGTRKFYLSPQFIFHLLLYYLHFPSRIRYDEHLFKHGLQYLLKGRSGVQHS